MAECPFTPQLGDIIGEFYLAGRDIPIDTDVITDRTHWVKKLKLTKKRNEFKTAMRAMCVRVRHRNFYLSAIISLIG